MVAVNDGRITRLGRSRKLGRFVELQDTYGNTYLYSGLERGRQDLPVPQGAQGAQARPRAARGRRRRPKRAASQLDAGRPAPPPRQDPLAHGQGREAAAAAPAKERLAASGAALPAALPAKERLFAHPARPNAKAAGGDEQLGRRRDREVFTLDGRRLDPKDYVAKPLKKGARVIGGTDPRPHRQDALRRSPRTCASRSARPAAARRASTRSRSSTAGSCSSRRRSTAPRSATRSSAPTPRRPRSARSC